MLLLPSVLFLLLPTRRTQLSAVGRSTAEQALDGLNGKVVVRHLSRGGQQAERSDSHGGWLPQRRFEPFDELLRDHHALMHQRSQNLGVENGLGGGDVQASVDAHSLSSFTHAGWRPHTDPMRVVHTLQSAQAR